jgi:hypothetical protein
VGVGPAGVSDRSIPRCREMRPSWLALVTLCACDPIMSIQGQVRSQASAAPARALPGADITLACPESRESLATTGADGSFEYTRIGRWPERCGVEVSTFDGSHAPVTRKIPELCRSGGDSGCYRITAADFTLTRLREERRTTRVLFRPDNDRLELVQNLGTREEVLCAAPCDAELLSGPRRLSVRLRNTTRELWSEDVPLADDRGMHVRFIEDPDPAWPSTLGMVAGAAGAGLLLYGSLKDETAPLIAGASTLAVGLTVALAWTPGMHSAEVRWAPAASLDPIPPANTGP